jgi:hypothetical protein
MWIGTASIGERADTMAELMAGQEPQTRFGRVMSLLGVELILANCSQATHLDQRCVGTAKEIRFL